MIMDQSMGYNGLMWLEQCHKPPMTGNGKDTTYKNGDFGDGLFLFVATIIFFIFWVPKNHSAMNVGFSMKETIQRDWGSSILMDTPISYHIPVS